MKALIAVAVLMLAACSSSTAPVNSACQSAVDQYVLPQGVTDTLTTHGDTTTMVYSYFGADTVFFVSEDGTCVTVNQS